LQGLDGRFATAAGRSAALLSGREALLKGLILGLPRPINKKPAKQPCARADSGAKPGIARDRTDCRTASGADGRAGQRSLLGWIHIGASI
jgi:hypothetical protein